VVFENAKFCVLLLSAEFLVIVAKGVTLFRELGSGFFLTFASLRDCFKVYWAFRRLSARLPRLSLNWLFLKTSDCFFE